MDRQTVVTSDDHKLGTVVDERDGCVIIESGHVFKSKHAIPREFLHDVTVTLPGEIGARALA